MRFGSHIAAVATAAALLLASAEQASAQTFFQKLFGMNKPQATRPAPPTQRRVIPPRPLLHERRESGTSGRQQTTRSSGGRYRTMCVRMCDGYYFPISSSASRRRFRHDARVCRSRCGEEAKLFYHPRSAGSVDGMVDMSGRMYAKLDIAFRYRKRLVDNCRCRPDPWTEAERARHASYAQTNADITADVKASAGDEVGTAEHTESTVAPTSTKATLPTKSASRRASVTAQRSRRRAVEKTKVRYRPKTTQQRRRVRAKKKTSAQFPWMGNAKSSYRFPGD